MPAARQTCADPPLARQTPLISRSIQYCEVLAPYYDLNAAQNCQPALGTMQEPGDGAPQDLVPISTLPGCNLLWGTGAKPTCPGGSNDPNPAAWEGTDGSLIALASEQKIYVPPTTPGWHDAGCIKFAPIMLDNSTAFWDDTISATKCGDLCLNSGYAFAAVGPYGNTFVS